MIGKAAIMTVGIYSGTYVLKSVHLRLRYFSPAEFGLWWPFVDIDLLKALDEYRHMLQSPVIISPAEGAIGRINSSNDSMHDLLKQGSVKAVDVMVPGVPLKQAYDIADKSGLFGGVGAYPDWKPDPGLHLDVRDEAGARWSALLVDGKQEYYGIERAFT